jgi:hypothetical protein
MIRRLINALSVLSLLLLVATAVLWVRARSFRDAFARTNAQGDGWVVTTTSRGAAGVEWTVRRVEPRDGSARRFMAYTNRHAPGAIVVGIRPARRGLGFGAEQFMLYARIGPNRQAMNWSGVLVPFWSLMVAFGLLPAHAAWRRLRRRRAAARTAAGFCVACGYDLRGTPGRCPECGRAVPAPNPAAQEGAGMLMPHVAKDR